MTERVHKGIVKMENGVYYFKCRGFNIEDFDDMLHGTFDIDEEVEFSIKSLEKEK